MQRSKIWKTDYLRRLSAQAALGKKEFPDRHLVSGFHEFDSWLQHAPPGSLGFRIKHWVEFLDGLHQPVKPQIIKFRLYICPGSAVELGEPFQMNGPFGPTAGRHHYV